MLVSFQFVNILLFCSNLFAPLSQICVGVWNPDRVQRLDRGSLEQAT